MVDSNQDNDIATITATFGGLTLSVSATGQGAQAAAGRLFGVAAAAFPRPGGLPAEAEESAPALEEASASEATSCGHRHQPEECLPEDWPARLAAARSIGQWAASWLRGDRAESQPQKGAPHLRSQVWIVFRNYQGVDLEPVQVFRRASPANAISGGSKLVAVPAGPGLSISFPSAAEARECVVAAGRTWPSTGPV